MTESLFAGDESAMKSLGASLTESLAISDIVLLSGPLGAGKTTFVRGAITARGHEKLVRSPTFNLIQTFDTHPPIMHADLYRLKSADGIGLDEYFETHLCFIEWPERAPWIARQWPTWQIFFDCEGDGRRIEIQPPTNRV